MICSGTFLQILMVCISIDEVVEEVAHVHVHAVIGSTLRADLADLEAPGVRGLEEEGSWGGADSESSTPAAAAAAGARSWRTGPVGRGAPEEDGEAARD